MRLKVSRKDIFYFNKAKEIAEKSNFKRVHIGCVVVYHNTILAYGCNEDKTDTIQYEYNAYREMIPNKGKPINHFVHAEIKALKKIRYLDIDFDKVKIYIYRADLNGQMAMCRPCEACMNYIKKLGIKSIYYTTPNGYVCEINKENL